MAQRQDLHDLLASIVGANNQVYFQPPPTIQMTYPCVVYRRDDIKTDFASNGLYKKMKRYSLTVIDRNPDSTIPDTILGLEHCSFDRHFTKDGLNHDVFQLFF